MAGQQEQVIYAELARQHFPAIVAICQQHFRQLQWGAQGDDWLWIDLAGGRLQLDSFYSQELQLKGPRAVYAAARELVLRLPPDWVLRWEDPPRPDLTV